MEKSLSSNSNKILCRQTEMPCCHWKIIQRCHRILSLALHYSTTIVPVHHPSPSWDPKCILHFNLKVWDAMGLACPTVFSSEQDIGITKPILNFDNKKRKWLKDKTISIKIEFTFKQIWKNFFNPLCDYL